VNGIVLEYVDDQKELFFPIQSLHYCAAVRFVNVGNYAVEGGGERFLPLDSPFANLPNTQHPPVFAAMMRRTQVNHFEIMITTAPIINFPTVLRVSKCSNATHLFAQTKKRLMRWFGVASTPMPTVPTWTCRELKSARMVPMIMRTVLP